MSDKKAQTLGEKRVGIYFNPSNVDDVAKIKRMGADMIDFIAGMEVPTKETDEVNRLKAMAISKIEVGTMLGVKAATR